MWVACLEFGKLKYFYLECFVSQVFVDFSLHLHCWANFVTGFPSLESGILGWDTHCPTNFKKDLASLLTFLFLLQLLNTSFCTQTLSFFKFLHASFALEKFLIFAWKFLSLFKTHFYHFCAIIACCFVQLSDLMGGGNAQVQPLASTNNTQEGLPQVPHKKRFKNTLSLPFLNKYECWNLHLCNKPKNVSWAWVCCAPFRVFST